MSNIYIRKQKNNLIFLLYFVVFFLLSAFFRGILSEINQILRWSRSDTSFEEDNKFTESMESMSSKTFFLLKKYCFVMWWRSDTWDDRKTLSKNEYLVIDIFEVINRVMETSIKQLMKFYLWRFIRLKSSILEWIV